jgi:hypothetical protein
MSADSIDSDSYVDASIDNAHLADNAVDTAEIADNAVTLAKMAGLARGTLIYGDTNGDPAALAAGGADEVLTHDGTDLAWAAAAGGGKLGQVVQSTVSPAQVDIGSSTFVQLTDGTTPLVLSITPSATSSSVLMLLTIPTACGLWEGYGVSLRRAGVSIRDSQTDYEVFNDNSLRVRGIDTWMELDTGISTVSSTEYSVYVKTNGALDVTFMNGNEHGIITLMEILA